MNDHSMRIRDERSTYKAHLKARGTDTYSCSILTTVEALHQTADGIPAKMMLIDEVACLHVNFLNCKPCY